MLFLSNCARTLNLETSLSKKQNFIVLGFISNRYYRVIIPFPRYWAHPAPLVISEPPSSSPSLWDSLPSPSSLWSLYFKSVEVEDKVKLKFEREKWGRETELLGVLSHFFFHFSTLRGFVFSHQSYVLLDTPSVRIIIKLLYFSPSCFSFRLEKCLLFMVLCKSL